MYLLVTESNGGVVVGLVDLGGLEDELVDEGGRDSTEDRSEPVDLKGLNIVFSHRHLGT